MTHSAFGHGVPAAATEMNSPEFQNSKFPSYETSSGIEDGFFRGSQVAGFWGDFASIKKESGGAAAFKKIAASSGL